MMEQKKWSPLLVLRFMLKIIIGAALFAYPFAIYFGLTHIGLKVIAPLLLVIFLLRLFIQTGKLAELAWFIKATALAGAILVLASWFLEQTEWLLYYPVVVSLVLFCVFSYSLFYPPTIIERFARLTHPDLPEAGVIYTRKVTKVWCLFFILNATIALFTCLSNDISLWTLYNGAISYMLIGLLMGIEWIVRKRLQQ